MKNNLALLLLFFSVYGRAHVSLPSYLSDNMVLQRNSEVEIWGYAAPLEDITVTTSWDKREYKAKGGSDARFSVVVKTGPAGGPHFFTVKGWNEITVKNILFGEVWLCSGQSNMEMTPEWGLDNASAEIASATDSGIRFATIPKRSSPFPQEELQTEWVECTPASMKRFSSVAYFFAQRLREEIKEVPIGIVLSAWGGSPAEIWMPQEAVSSNETIRKAAAVLNPGDYSPVSPGLAYNAMIHPLLKMKIAGVLWYQGESNVGSQVYELTVSALIDSWRGKWGYDFPFYLAQIAAYDYGNDGVSGSVIRDAQRKIPEMLRNTGMVVISDVSDAKDLHPKNKKPVGRRLAGIALKETYGKTVGEVYGPVFSGFTVNGKKGVVSFTHADGLHFASKKSTLFELCGADGVFYPAQAVIKGNTVVVTAENVRQPVRVRYAFRNDDKPDLFNSALLPASTFESNPTQPRP